MIKCKNADNYKGLRPPTCNNGNPCDTCTRIYYEAKERRESDDAMTQDCGFSSTIGTATFNKDFWR